MFVCLDSSGRPGPLSHCPTVTMGTRKWVKMGHTSLRAIDERPDIKHAKLWTTCTHRHTLNRERNRLDASVIYQFLTHIPSLSLNVCKHGPTPAHTYVVTAPHSHTPTEVAWIITFTARLLSNSKPTCQCIVCLCVYFPVELSKADTVDRILFPSN